MPSLQLRQDGDITVSIGGPSLGEFYNFVHRMRDELRTVRAPSNITPSPDRFTSGLDDLKWCALRDGHFGFVTNWQCHPTMDGDEVVDKSYFNTGTVHNGLWARLRRPFAVYDNAKDKNDDDDDE